MHIDDEENIVAAGNAVFIPGQSIHGIRNHGKVQLSYLTANTAFGIAREQEIWKH
jgi:mannose-6-phosphate isomerase-like protein (cupin superfamily)